MPKFLERKLKEEYGEKSAIPYKVMNSIGAMRGSKETAKGKAMETKHEKDAAQKDTDRKETPMRKSRSKPPTGRMRELRVEIHRGPGPKHAVTGFTVHHHMLPIKAKDSPGGAYMEHETHTQPFSAKEHGCMMDHVEEHLEGVMGNSSASHAEPDRDEE